ncbi:MAG: hypothetical protein ACOX2E_08705 [Syntrophaceticus sp.]|jgi:predicted nucleic acid-binding protein
MKIVDANIVLRYLLNDTEDLSEKAANLLENNEVFVPNESDWGRGVTKA